MAVIWLLDWLKPAGEVTAIIPNPVASGWNDAVRAFGVSAPLKVTVGLGKIDPIPLGSFVIGSVNVMTAEVPVMPGLSCCTRDKFKYVVSSIAGTTVTVVAEEETVVVKLLPCSANPEGFKVIVPVPTL